jgi:hypothetical protein
LREGNDNEFRVLVEDTQGRSFFLDPKKGMEREQKQFLTLFDPPVISFCERPMRRVPKLASNDAD